jgi:hypothetical protein
VFLDAGGLECVEMVGAGSRGLPDSNQRLQGEAKFGHHGAIWEALPAIEYYLPEHLKARTPQSEPRLCYPRY